MDGWAFWRIAVGLSLAGPAVAMPADPRPRIVHADVVALDHLLVYNRFGSFNPYGMIFALRRDVSALDGAAPSQPVSCETKDGTESGTGSLEPGKVRLKDCKRPRPLVLRGAVGDILEVQVTNLLGGQPDISDTWCKSAQSDGGTHPTRAVSRRTFDGQCRDAAEIEDRAEGEEKAALDAERRGDWPRTRGLSFVVPGLEPVGDATGAVPPPCLGLAAVAPGGSFTCRFRLDREGTHLFSSLAAPAGGEGDGGSLTQGLFGALIVEAAGAGMYRSQVPKAAFDKVWSANAAKPDLIHARSGEPDYATSVPQGPEDPGRRGSFECGTAQMPVLGLIRDCTTVVADGGEQRRAEIVHGDLNAIIVPGPRSASSGPRSASSGPGENTGPYARTGEDLRTEERLEREARLPFREFTVVFHDELKTFYADAFKDLDAFGQLSGVRDGFAINYGASGLGAMMIAQRKGIGPAANCPECLYEEFFLESWANGDPALLERYVDDPSNVHHSYLNDKVVFRNLHAGKETHVFHLHTHQWFAGNDENRGAYLDSQTIGPQQGFTYRIYHGGLDRHDPRGEAGDPAQTPAARGYFENAKGSGNRNRTVGDAIFHCHLYPHFAQGMWELWRVHDVLEDGSRRLPDGQRSDGLSTAPAETGARGVRRGSVDPETGVWLGGGPAQGTPVPGLVPIPGEALPPIPTYGAAGGSAADPVNAMPGYPFYIAGIPGHRAPQPPLDMAFQSGAAGAPGTLLDGGLPRHVVADGVAVPAVATPEERALLAADPGARAGRGSELIARGLALGDVTSEFERLTLRLLPHAGTALERNAMAFHHDGLRRWTDAQGQAAAPVAIDVRRPDGTAAGPQEGGGYRTGSPGTPADGRRFSVNGAPPAPGAPFADPCGAPSTMAGHDFRRFFGLREGEGESGGTHDSFSKATFADMADPLVAGDTSLSPIRTPGLPFVPDPGLIGLRRYEVSAVQFDMTVNRAGWHDPQARMAVLTRKAADWKSQRSARAEPFFFRAFSGECIELRHTNETPKDLELDDFQLKVPTDTIGQHIHLVKFDVTSSDGSGNGFNYEDATFAPDEILARICAAAKTPNGVIGGAVADRTAECKALADAKTALDEAVRDKDPSLIREAQKAIRAAQVWHRTDAAARRYFQTTVQRWFADPILSNTGDGRATDRTLRTVFTHDHFTPSNIQQHGYYAALLIEPNTHTVERFQGPEDGPSTADMSVVQPPRHASGTPPALALGGPELVGARANVRALSPARREGALDTYGYGDPIHPDTREYALAIADMALLYDGNGQGEAEFEAEAEATSSPKGSSPKGMSRLLAESACRIQAVTEDDVARDADLEQGERIPARHGGLCVTSAGNGSLPRPRDAPSSAFEPGLPNAAHAGARLALKLHAKFWRAAHGRPIEPPPRPEAITQKHHNPYLVSYRGEPVPLRIGAHGSNGQPFAFGGNPCSVPRNPATPPALPTPDDEARRPNTASHREIHGHRTGEAGNLANVFRSAWTHKGTVYGHGDPCTPLIEGYGNERVLVRLIQGAQEVQHMFRVEGAPFRRNVDQPFPSARPLLSHANGLLRSRFDRCQENRDARDGRPRQFRDWLTGKNPGDSFWKAFADLARDCDNLMGVVAAQELGISEHFEIGGYFRSETPAIALFRARGIDLDRLGASTDDDTGPKAGLRDRTIRRNNTGTNPTLHPEIVGTSDNRQALDYQYSFGSTDALWNGAFGLIRIYDGPEASDLGRCLHGPVTGDRCLGPRSERIGSRLKVLRSPFSLFGAPRQPASTGTGEPAADPSSAGPSLGVPTLAAEQSLACPSGAPQVAAVMVAVRAGEVLDKSSIALPGLPYDPEKKLFDPDGLLIVGLTLADLADSFRPKTVHELLEHGLPDRRRLLELIREKDGKSKFLGSQPHPFVLRAMAGDCVTALMINALGPRGGNGNIRDIPGDALMPKIVPLNTDSLQTGGSDRELRSSSRVVFTLPASLTSPRSGVAFPFGINAAPALATEEEAEGPDIRNGRKILPAASWRTTTLYAGTLFVEAPKLLDILIDPPTPWAFELLPGRWVSAGRRAPAGCGSAKAESAVLGVLFCIGWQDGATDPVPLDFTPSAIGDKAAKARDVAESLVDFLKVPAREAAFLKATPYAFGAMPIRVAGDIFGHAAHGLTGTMIVEPRFEKAVAVTGCTTEEILSIPGRTHRRVPDAETKVDCPVPGQFDSVAGPWSEQGVLIEQSAIAPCRKAEEPGRACSETIPAATIREHTLLWQDGLNLWSRTWSQTWSRPPSQGTASADPVRWGYDTGIDQPWDPTLPPDQRGYPGHPLPNCSVCDDSYDLGEKGVSYRSAPFARRLADWGNPLSLGLTRYPNDAVNLNAAAFPSAFFDAGARTLPTPRLVAYPGEELAIRVAHPAGRARQRSFLLLGHAYDDLLPGFGSGHTGLLGPGKALTAAVCASRAPASYLYRDGPQHIFAGGVYGHLDVAQSSGPSSDRPQDGKGRASACTP